ncbi:hypothetical protein ACS0TY_006541 [Phlomoides rotata]
MVLDSFLSTPNDTIDASQSIRDGETLVSSGDIFELGFFNPRNSTNWYLGIWYKNMPDRTVVWVANRESPLRNNSGIFIITVKIIFDVEKQSDRSRIEEFGNSILYITG